MEKKTYFTIIPKSSIADVFENGIAPKDRKQKVFLFSKIAHEVKDEFIVNDMDWTIVGINHDGITGSILIDEDAKLKKAYRFIIEQEFIHPRYLILYDGK